MGKRHLNEAAGVSGGFGVGVFAGHWSRVSSHETYNGGREMGGGRGRAGWLEGNSGLTALTKLFETARHKPLTGLLTYK